MEYLVHAANLLYFASYFVRDVLRLRVYSVAAASCLVPYLYLRPEPLVEAVCWNLFFIMMNGCWVFLLVRERRDTDHGGEAQRNDSQVPGRDDTESMFSTAAFRVSQMADATRCSSR